MKSNEKTSKRANPRAARDCNQMRIVISLHNESFRKLEKEALNYFLNCLSEILFSASF